MKLTGVRCTIHPEGFFVRGAAGGIFGAKKRRDKILVRREAIGAARSAEERSGKLLERREAPLERSWKVLEPRKAQCSGVEKYWSGLKIIGALRSAVERGEKI